MLKTRISQLNIKKDISELHAESYDLRAAMIANLTEDIFKDGTEDDRRFIERIKEIVEAAK